MFEKIANKTLDQVTADIVELVHICHNYPDIGEFVRYIIAVADASDMGYKLSNIPDDVKIGQEIIQIVYEFSGVDFSTMSNQFHFNTAWPKRLASVISDFFIEFRRSYVVEKLLGGLYEFRLATNGDDDLKNDVKFVVEAAKANVANYEKQQKKREAAHKLMMDNNDE